jgi:hypothetical protein
VKDVCEHRQRDDAVEALRRIVRSAGEEECRDDRFGSAHAASGLERLDLGALRREDGPERLQHVPRPSERDRTPFVAEEPHRSRQGRFHRGRPALGDGEIEIGEGQDAVADERLFADIVDDAKLTEATEEKRTGSDAICPW